MHENYYADQLNEFIKGKTVVTQIHLMQKFSLQIGKTTKIFNLNSFKVNFQNLEFRHRLTASNLDAFFSGMLKISPGGLFTTLVYGGVRMKGQIQTQKLYGSIKTVFPNFSA